MRENKNDIHIIRRAPLLRVCTKIYIRYKPEVSIYFVRALYIYKSYNIGCRFLYIYFHFFMILLVFFYLAQHSSLVLSPVQPPALSELLASQYYNDVDR